MMRSGFAGHSCAAATLIRIAARNGARAIFTKQSRASLCAAALHRRARRALLVRRLRRCRRLPSLGSMADEGRRRRAVAPRRGVARRRGAAYRRGAGAARALPAWSSLPLLARAEQQQLRRLGVTARRHRVRFGQARDRTQMAKLILREATRADARAIADIHVTAWRAAYRDLMPQSYLESLSIDERARMWEKTIARPGPAQLALAELDGELAGFCLYGPTRDREATDVAEIYAVNVRPARWRQGAGR